MTNNIFADNAPKYWAAGLPVIPLRPREKMPAIHGWQEYGSRMPTEAEQALWLQQHPDGNIGLPFGPASGLVGIDIDTEDAELEEIIEETVGLSPWSRVGQKGSLMVFKYIPGQKIVRLKTVSGEMLVEILSTGSQAVLPPSIHPKTQEPYTSNCELLDVMQNIPILDHNIEGKLRSAIQAFGIEVGSSGFGKTIDWVSVGSRDSKMTQYAGLLAAAVRRGELPLIESFGRIEAWFENHVQSVAGDDISIEKGRTKICEFLHRDVMGDRRLPLAQGWDEGMTSEMKENMNLDFDKSVEEWDYEQHIEHLKEQFDKHGQGTRGRQMAIKKSIDRIIASPSMSHLEKNQIYRYIANTNRSIAVSDLKGEIHERTRGEITGEDHNELAGAVISLMKQYGELKYWSGHFWRWGGSHYQKVDENDILKEIAENFGTGYNAAKKQSDHRGILKVMASKVSGDLCDANADVSGINFANGFLTPDMVLRDHDPKYGMTYTLPFRYMPELEGTAFRFQQLLHDCWGPDPDYVQKLQAIQEVICATLFNMATKFQKACLLFGVPSSGKSVILEIISSLVPVDAKCVLPPSEWNDKFLPEKMVGCVLNVAGELSEHKFIDGQAFKQIVVGEEITVQRKNGQPFSMRPTCMHLFGSNHLPRTRDSSSAFNRRWLILNFTHPVSEEKKDPDLAVKIVQEEREALIAWAAQAMPRLIEQGTYTVPESHKMMIKEVASNNNLVRQFMTESPMIELDQEETKEISEEDLYNVFFSEAVGPGFGSRPVPKKVFRSSMRELMPELGFGMVERETARGGKEVSYSGIRFVK